MSAGWLSSSSFLRSLECIIRYQSGKASPAKSFQSRQRPLAKSFQSRQRLWRSLFCKIWSPEASRDPNADHQSLSRLSNDFARGLWRLWNDFAGEASPDWVWNTRKQCKTQGIRVKQLETVTDTFGFQLLSKHLTFFTPPFITFSTRILTPVGKSLHEHR